MVLRHGKGRGQLQRVGSRQRMQPQKTSGGFANLTGRCYLVPVRSEAIEARHCRCKGIG
jgi:hypothetical protein